MLQEAIHTCERILVREISRWGMAGAKCVFVLIWIDVAKLPFMGLQQFVWLSVMQVSEDMASEQRSKRQESHIIVSKQREQLVQRSWGRKDCYWCVGGTERRLMWLEQRE